MAEAVAATRGKKNDMPYLSKRFQTEKLEAQVEAQRVELVALRNDLRIARAERDAAKEGQARHWHELTILHRVFDKLLLRLEKYEGVEGIDNGDTPNEATATK
jgi:hypothetical protein